MKELENSAKVGFMVRNNKWLHVLVGGLVTFSSAFAAIERRVFCEDPRPNIPYTNKTIEDYKPYLDANHIRNVSGDQLDVRNLEEFLFEYKKFPASLRQELIEANASINLITGNSVTDDPTWKREHVLTFDKRNWADTVGAGGSPSGTNQSVKAYVENLKYIAGMKKYCSHPAITCDKDWSQEVPKPVIEYPSRIVVNELYLDQKGNAAHGSVNLFLHEHGHALDSIYSTNGVSKSEAWVNLVSTPEIRDYMKVVCKDPQYCLNNNNEAFAELLAYHFSCEGSRKHMERNAPQLAEYFQNLNRINPVKGKVKKPSIFKSAPKKMAATESVVSSGADIQLPKVKKPKFNLGGIFNF